MPKFTGSVVRKARFPSFSEVFIATSALWSEGFVTQGCLIYSLSDPRLGLVALRVLRNEASDSFERLLFVEWLFVRYLLVVVLLIVVLLIPVP